MNPVALLLLSFFILMILNVPLAWSLGLSVVLYIVNSGFMSLDFIATSMFTGADNFPLMAIPLFILAGSIMQGGGIARRLLDLVDAMVGHKRGGLAMATIMGCMFFSAISGSSAATVATIGTIMVPTMIKAGYSKGFAYALVVAGGTLGVLLPPSIPIIVFGVATGTSIATMFIASLGVGFLIFIILMIFAYVICVKNDWKGNGLEFSGKRVAKALWSAAGALILPVIILGGIYGGIFTPTEAAAVAVFYGLFVGFFGYREMDLAKLKDALSSSAVTTCTIMVIVAVATAFARVLTLEQVPVNLARFITGLTDNPIVLLLIINIALIVICTVMDATPAILILAPLLQPIAVAYGVDSVHFGLIMVLNVVIGFITPPVGLNIFVATSIGDIEFHTLIKNLIPFWGAMLIGLMLVTYIPAISLGIPWLLGYGQ